ncbi:hypothetical protein Btru_012309, partial [Bulinus truncatus]
MRDGQFVKETQLKLEIVNIFKSSHTSVYNVTFESWDQKNLLNFVSETLNNLMILNQEDLRVVKDVASIINFDSTASEEQKRELRTKMLSSLKDFHVQHVETIELVSFSVLLLSDTKKEIEENGLCLDRGRKLTDAVSFIALVLMKSLFLKQEPVTISTDDLDVQLETSHINLTSMFNLNSLDGQVKFSMPGKSLGEGIIKINTDFEVYRKNPYFGISENIQGEIPLVQLQFFEQKLNSLNFDQKSFRFSEPADVVLQFDAKEATVLSLSSPGIPNVLVKARYTNTISDFEYLYDEEMLMFPLQKLEILNKSSFSLVRKSNLFFLPMLQRFQIQKSIKYYRVLIRLKLYQKVDQNFFEGAKNMSLHNVTVHVVPYKMSCLHFDRDAHKFLSDKCLLSLFSNVHLIHCQCVVAAAFTGSYLVTPRLINPLDIGLFIEIFHNPLVIRAIFILNIKLRNWLVSMVIALWLTAIAAFLYGRRKDKEDEIKRNVTVLDDNKEDHSYIYLICVITGWFARAYTTSNVFIVIKGTWSKSETRLLNDTTKKLFQSGSENWFLLTTKEDLGNIQSIELWTDFSGCHPSWYLNCVYVQNMLTNESWMCTYNNWFNCEFGKANLKAEIPAIKEKDYMGKKLLQFVRLSQYNIRNEHLWFGMVAKSSYNMFTRVRRIVTGLTMLQTLMLVNLMFFGIVDFDDSRQFMEILGYKMHLTSIIIGFQSSLIITIVGLSVAYMFNGVDPRPKQALELSEEEKELVQTRLERNHYNLTHPVFCNVKRHSDLTTISDSLIYNEERDKDKTFLNILLERKGANTSENASHQRHSLKEEEESETEDFSGISVADTDDGKQKRKEQVCFQLPWWFIYITWMTLALFNVFLAYYIMLYGLSLGYEKSVDWTIAFFTGFLTDILIFQPVKVVLIAFILILILKQKYTIKSKAPLTKHNETLEILYHNITLKKKLGVRSTQVVYQIPLNSSDLKDALNRLTVENLAREMMRDFFLYNIFMFCVILVIYGHSDVFNRYQQIKFAKQFYLGIKEPFEENDQGENKLDEIHEASQMWDYLSDVIQKVVPDEKENKLQESPYLFGSARLRQARVKPNYDSCLGLPETIRNIYETDFCIPSMENGQEENNSFVNTWTNVYEGYSEDLEDSPFVYKSEQQLQTSYFKGQLARYSGGGYVANISRDSLTEANKTLENIKQSKWLDQYTRCIFLECNLINPGPGLILNVIVAFELDGTSGIFPVHSVSAAHFYFNSRKENWLSICEGLTVICVIFYTFVEMSVVTEQVEQCVMDILIVHDVADAFFLFLVGVHPVKNGKLNHLGCLVGTMVTGRIFLLQNYLLAVTYGCG